MGVAVVYTMLVPRDYKMPALAAIPSRRWTLAQLLRLDSTQRFTESGLPSIIDLARALQLWASSYLRRHQD
jgi:hypothetical protein